MVVILVHDNYSASLPSCRRVDTDHCYEQFNSMRDFSLLVKKYEGYLNFMLWLWATVSVEALLFQAFNSDILRDSNVS